MSPMTANLTFPLLGTLRSCAPARGTSASQRPAAAKGDLLGRGVRAHVGNAVHQVLVQFYVLPDLVLELREHTRVHLDVGGGGDVRVPVHAAAGAPGQEPEQQT